MKIKKSSEDRTQLSPVSVLEATLSCEDSPVHISKFLYQEAFILLLFPILTHMTRLSLEPFDTLLPR